MNVKGVEIKNVDLLLMLVIVATTVVTVAGKLSGHNFMVVISSVMSAFGFYSRYEEHKAKQSG